MLGMGMCKKIGPGRHPGCSHCWPLLACTSGVVAGTATHLVNSFATQTAFGDHDGDGDGFGRPGPGAKPRTPA